MKFNIDQVPLFKVQCKDCFDFVRFESVDQAHEWISDHECAGN